MTNIISHSAIASVVHDMHAKGAITDAEVSEMSFDIIPTDEEVRAYLAERRGVYVVPYVVRSAMYAAADLKVRALLTEGEREQNVTKLVDAILILRHVLLDERWRIIQEATRAFCGDDGHARRDGAKLSFQYGGGRFDGEIRWKIEGGVARLARVTGDPHQILRLGDDET